MKIILSEGMIHLDEDVDYLYNKYFKEQIDEIKETGVVKPSMFKFKVDHTKNLKSNFSKLANNKKSCAIYVNDLRYNYGNFYNPNKKIIHIGVGNAFDYVMKFDGDLEKVRKHLYGKLKRKFNNEFTEYKIKGSINHELIHWVDDALRNEHLTKTAKKFKKKVGKQYKGKSFFLSNIELQGQLRNIYQLKKYNEDTWDLIDFDEVIDMSPSLSNINDKLKDDDNKSWRKKLLSRMYREGLLGDNMP